MKDKIINLFFVKLFISLSFHGGEQQAKSVSSFRRKRKGKTIGNKQLVENMLQLSYRGIRSTHTGDLRPSREVRKAPSRGGPAAGNASRTPFVPTHTPVKARKGVKAT